MKTMNKYDELRDLHPRHNRIMGYVLQACNDLNVELTEIYCNPLKCVYRFKGEDESQAHFFLYSSGATYGLVLEAIRDVVDSLTFDDIGYVKND
jgi:hypothetical protein